MNDSNNWHVFFCFRHLVVDIDFNISFDLMVLYEKYNKTITYAALTYLLIKMGKLYEF